MLNLLENGYGTAISGLFVVFTGIFVILKSGDELTIDFYGNLIFFAGILWILAAAVYANLIEVAGEISGGGNALKETIKKLDLLKVEKIYEVL